MCSWKHQAIVDFKFAVNGKVQVLSAWIQNYDWHAYPSRQEYIIGRVSYFTMGLYYNTLRGSRPL